MECPGCDYANRERAEFCGTGSSRSPVGLESQPDNDFYKVTERPVNHHYFRGIFPGLGGFRL